MSTTIIIGAGVFGASTALSLAKRGGTNVILVDASPFPSPRSASHDISKIVRDDYPDTLYMRMLQKAMPTWREDELYKTFYHEVGMLRADTSDFGAASLAAYKEVGIDNESEFLAVDEVRQRWNGAFATANFDGLTEILYNPTVGFAEADKALGAVVQAAIDHGAQFVMGEVESLTFGSEGQCTGVALLTGQCLQADRVLVCAGARTASLLAQSAPENKELHAGSRLLATGAVSFWAKLQGAQMEKFAPIPVLKNCLPQVKGEGMSMLEDGTIKFNCDMCFTNFRHFPPTGESMSLVPDSEFYQTWVGPKFIQFFQERARKTLDGLYGKEVESIPIESYRICWDASTPTHDFLITPHPHSKSLFIATGGSFHGWKFLPVIGEYVVDMMDGVLAEEYASRWAWDKKGGDGHSANPTYQVVGDLKDWVK